MAGRALLIEAVRRRQRPYRASHPLAIPRTALAIDLIRACGALDARDGRAAATPAPEALCRFHDAGYVAAIVAAQERGGLAPQDRERYNLGGLENPWFEDLYTITATAAGGSVEAADAVLAGHVAFNPAGGMHHARRARAEGFCYFNDPVLAVLRLRDAGLRVLYADIDAHHGDGVEAAFADDPDVLTLSLHMDTAYAYPFRGGKLDDAGSPRGDHACINVPLPRQTNDAEYALLFDAAFEPARMRFAPDAIVLQAGTDMLAADPLGKLGATTQGYLAIVRRVWEAAPRHPDATPRLLVTGGGGYHPLLVARAWAGLWAMLSGRELPEAIPPAGAAALRAAGWDRDDDQPYYPRLFEAFTDAPGEGSVRTLVREIAAALARHPYLR